jgi:hypothetical protein
MNYQAFTNDSLTMMYEAIRGALAADDALKRQGMEIRFRVRETPDWKKHAGELESEMLKRGMFFDVIDWSEDQVLPLEEWPRAQVRARLVGELVGIGVTLVCPLVGASLSHWSKSNLAPLLRLQNFRHRKRDHVR